MDRAGSSSDGRVPWTSQQQHRTSNSSQDQQQSSRPSMDMMGAIPRRPRPPPPSMPSGHHHAPSAGPPPPSMTAAIPRRNSNKGPTSSMMSSTDSIPRRPSTDFAARRPSADAPIPRRPSAEVPRRPSTDGHIPRRLPTDGPIPRRPSTSAPIPRRPSSDVPFHRRPPADAPIPRRPSADVIPPRPSTNAPIPRRPSADAVTRHDPSDSESRHSSLENSHKPLASNGPHQSHPKDYQAPTSSSPPSPGAGSRKQQRDLPIASKRSNPPRTQQVGGGISIQSETPFVIRIPLHGVNIDHGQGIYRHRQSTRTPKRKRPSYEELRDTDSDDFLSDSDDEPTKKKKDSSKKARRLVKTAAAASSVTSSVATASDIAPDDPNAVATQALTSNSLEAPPQGTLSTLWYSRECFLHVFVMEKVLSWKTRPVTQLEWVKENFPEGESPPTPLPTVDPADATTLLNLALTKESFWRDQHKRMEVSRLLPQNCPVVLNMAAAREFKETQGKPKFRVRQFVPDEQGNHQREEVLLVKWRGRSHLHASWERKTDIVKYDQSNNTARHKIRRFVQYQEMAFGKSWKQVLEEERATAAAIHAHGGQVASNDVADSLSTSPHVPTAGAGEDDQGEEYFPLACIEVERILACDESEMDLQLFPKQRALNIRAEQELVRQRELPESQVKKWNTRESLEDLLQELPWDPEDNVRYVVKWKGLPFAEMTWEYWRDIKQDAVEEVEDFWYRQKPPDQDEIEANGQPHPHMKDFRKIQESPEFGVSKRKRSVADLGDGQQVAPEDDDATSTGLKLRSYQLEGVNWLLFNWWNKRSCILADGTNKFYVN